MRTNVLARDDIFVLFCVVARPEVMMFFLAPFEWEEDPEPVCVCAFLSYVEIHDK